MLQVPPAGAKFDGAPDGRGHDRLSILHARDQEGPASRDVEGVSRAARTGQGIGEDAAHTDVPQGRAGAGKGDAARQVERICGRISASRGPCQHQAVAGNPGIRLHGCDAAPDDLSCSLMPMRPNGGRQMGTCALVDTSDLSSESAGAGLRHFEIAVKLGPRLLGSEATGLGYVSDMAVRHASAHLRWLWPLVIGTGCTVATSRQGSLPVVGAVSPSPSTVSGTAFVRNAAGAAVAGARVRVFETNQVPSGLPEGLVSNAAGGLVANAAGAFRTLAWLAGIPRSRRLQAVTEVTTDEAGNYRLSLPPGRYNIEASAPDGRSKAWRGALEAGPDGILAVEPLVLQPTGRISGRVTVADTTVTDLLRTQVFVPGSSYEANTTSDGRFLMSDVPVGSFPLFAWHPTLGEAFATGRDAVRVESGLSVEAPQLRLVRERPSVTNLVAQGSDREVLAAAPGTRLELLGRHFGASKGRSFKVEVQGVTALSSERVSDGRLSFAVPSGARNGQVTLEVDGVFAEPLPLRVLKSVQWKSPDLTLALGATADVHPLLDVRDTDDIGVVPIRGQAGWLAPPAELLFRIDLPRVFLGPDGIIRAMSEGDAALTVSAGDLAPRTLSIKVLPEGQAVPTPGPEPTTVPTAVPTPVPTPTAVPVATLKERFSVAGTFVTAACSSEGAVWAAGTGNGQVVLFNDLDGGNVTLAGHPGRVPAPVTALAVSPGGAFVAVSWADSTAAILDRMGAIQAVVMPGAPARQLLFDPRGGNIWLAGLESGNLATVNGGGILRMASLGSGVRFLGLAAPSVSGKVALATLAGSGRLVISDLDTGASAIDMDISAGRGAQMAAVDDGWMAWVDGAGDVRIRALDSLKPGGGTAWLPAGTRLSISRLGFEADGAHLLLSRDQTLERYRIADASALASWTLKAPPVAIKARKDGTTDVLLGNGSMMSLPAP